MLTRYWITFQKSATFAIPYGSCGVTAYDLRDAIRLLEQWVVPTFGPLPEIAEVIENVDIRTLDEGHVRPNMGVSVIRSVWWPWMTPLR